MNFYKLFRNKLVLLIITVSISLIALMTVVIATGIATSYLSDLTLNRFFSTKNSPTLVSDFSAPFVFGQFSVPVNNPLTEEAIELGRHLFYDKRLSGNNLIACATCHKQELAFTDGKRFSIGASGKPLQFNSISLVNMLWGPQRFFWDGRAASLEEQALKPIAHIDEMDQDIELLVDELANIPFYKELFQRAYNELSAANVAKALATFQRTLISANSKYDKFLRGELSLNDQEELGRKLFMAHPDVKASLRGGNCIDCHSQFVTAGFSTFFDGFLNNGLDDEKSLKSGLFNTTSNSAHRGLFKTPSLRNIVLTAPYMHDGRFNTLEEVLNHYNSGIKISTTLSPLILEADNQTINQSDTKPSLNLSPKESDAIVAFLHTLTDEEFINNPVFSNPFIKADNER